MREGVTWSSSLSSASLDILEPVYLVDSMRILGGLFNSLTEVSAYCCGLYCSNGVRNCFCLIFNQGYVTEGIPATQRYLHTSLKLQIELISVYRHIILLSGAVSFTPICL